MKKIILLSLCLSVNLAWSQASETSDAIDPNIVYNSNFKKEQCLVDTSSAFVVCLGSFKKLHQTMYAVTEIGSGKTAYFTLGKTIQDQHLDKKTGHYFGEYAAIETEFSDDQMAHMSLRNNYSAFVYWTNSDGNRAQNGDLKIRAHGKSIVAKNFDRVPL